MEQKDKKIGNIEKQLPGAKRLLELSSFNFTAGVSLNYPGEKKVVTPMSVETPASPVFKNPQLPTKQTFKAPILDKSELMKLMSKSNPQTVEIEEHPIISEESLTDYIDKTMRGEINLISFMKEKELAIFDTYSEDKNTSYGVGYYDEKHKIAFLQDVTESGIKYINYPPGLPYYSQYAYAIVKGWCKEELTKFRINERNRLRSYYRKLHIEHVKKVQLRLKAKSLWIKLRNYVLVKRSILKYQLIGAFMKIRLLGETLNIIRQTNYFRKEYSTYLKALGYSDKKLIEEEIQILLNNIKNKNYQFKLDYLEEQTRKVRVDIVKLEKNKDNLSFGSFVDHEIKLDNKSVKNKSHFTLEEYKFKMQLLQIKKNFWFGFKVNFDLANLFYMLDINIKYLDYNEDNTILYHQRKQIIKVLLKLCNQTNSKQVIAFMKKWHVQKDRLKGYEEFQQTFMYWFDFENDLVRLKRSFLLACSYLTGLTGVKTIFRKNLRDCLAVKNL